MVGINTEPLHDNYSYVYSYTSICTLTNYGVSAGGGSNSRNFIKLAESATSPYYTEQPNDKSAVYECLLLRTRLIIFGVIIVIII